MTARPQVTLKLATSLDGRIATASGESKWITGPAARAAGHALRAAHDAILIGAETAVTDDPELTARTEPPAARQPLRVVLDTRLRLSPDSRLMRTLSYGPVLIVCGRDADRGARAALEAAGARVRSVGRGLDGLDLADVLDALHEESAARLLVEGGGRVAASFLRAGLVDALEWFRAPRLLGAEGRPGIAELQIAALADAPRFKRVAVKEIEADLWESYLRAE
jgi:diaminohydroxyphosphoribosylaminopyrimidine deaminase/5-amino-6-(5-phosphoribosylamino)uracil reductase